jgi:hypothetical protein
MDENRRLPYQAESPILFIRHMGMMENITENTSEAEVEKIENSLTEEQVLSEAFAIPILGEGEFMFGGRKFQVVSLGYKQYLQFVSRLKPIIGLVASKLKNTITDAVNSKVNVGIPGIALSALGDIDPAYLLNFCAEDLPQMVEIVCNMKPLREEKLGELVTAQWVEDNAQSPFELINIVLAQVNKNKMIVQFADFFAQVLPIFLSKRPATDQAR